MLARARDVSDSSAGSYTRELDAELEKIVRDTPPTDCWGHVGDVVL
jgi:hypothetical protein